MSMKFFFVTFTQFLKLKQFVSAQLSNLGYSEVYVVEIYPSNNAEKYVVEELKVTSLPVYSLVASMQLQVLVQNADFNSLYDIMRSFKVIPTSLTSFPSNLTGSEVVDIIMSEVLDEQGGLGEGAAGNKHVYEGPMRLYISGSFSSVGKSSICLGILSLLHERFGVSADRLFYIKPSTQCEKIQSVQKYCEKVKLSCAPLGPLVFYSGFTRSYLRGETENRGQILHKIHEAMETLEKGGFYGYNNFDASDTRNRDTLSEKRRGQTPHQWRGGKGGLTVIDGVGYPSVGSIINLSNRDIAISCRAPLLLVGKSGVGDAIDTFTLNYTYYTQAGARVLGGVWNRCEKTGYYSRDECESAVSLYFQLLNQGGGGVLNGDGVGGVVAPPNPPLRMYGFLPKVVEEAFESLLGTHQDLSDVSGDRMDVAERNTTSEDGSWLDVVSTYLNFPLLLYDVFVSQIILRNTCVEVSQVVNPSPLQNNNLDGYSHSGPAVVTSLAPAHMPPQLTMTPHSMPLSNASTVTIPHKSAYSQSLPVSPHPQVVAAEGGRKRTREEVEREAKSGGAKGG
eukprot:gene34744-42070_t